MSITQAKINFTISNKNDNDQIIYMTSFSSDYKTIISSNYYNVNVRTSGQYLTVENGCYIISIYYNPSSTGSFYVANLITVSDISTIPDQNTVINLNINTSNTVNNMLDLSNDVTSNSLNMGLYKTPVDKYISLLSNPDTSVNATSAESCLSNNLIIFGDAAQTEVGPSNINYYPNHNICVDPSLLSQIFNMYKSSLNKTSNGSNTSWLWVIIIIFIFIIIIAVVIGGFLWYRRKHKKV